MAESTMTRSITRAVLAGERVDHERARKARLLATFGSCANPVHKAA